MTKSDKNIYAKLWNKIRAEGLDASNIAEWTPYERVCQLLGFNSSVNFVTWNRGRVGFTLGKPNEISALRAACREHGIPMTRGLLITE